MLNVIENNNCHLLYQKLIWKWNHMMEMSLYTSQWTSVLNKLIRRNFWECTFVQTSFWSHNKILMKLFKSSCSCLIHECRTRRNLENHVFSQTETNVYFWIVLIICTYISISQENLCSQYLMCPIMGLSAEYYWVCACHHEASKLQYYNLFIWILCW